MRSAAIGDCDGRRKPLRDRNGWMTILVGTALWSDRSLIGSGRFYRKEASSAKSRFRCCANFASRPQKREERFFRCMAGSIGLLPLANFAGKIGIRRKPTLANISGERNQDCNRTTAFSNPRGRFRPTDASRWSRFADEKLPFNVLGKFISAQTLLLSPRCAQSIQAGSSFIPRKSAYVARSCKRGAALSNRSRTLFPSVRFRGIRDDPQ